MRFRPAAGLPHLDLHERAHAPPQPRIGRQVEVNQDVVDLVTPAFDGQRRDARHFALKLPIGQGVDGDFDGLIRADQGHVSLCQILRANAQARKIAQAQDRHLGRNQFALVYQDLADCAGKGCAQGAVVQCVAGSAYGSLGPCNFGLRGGEVFHARAGFNQVKLGLRLENLCLGAFSLALGLVYLGLGDLDAGLGTLRLGPGLGHLARGRLHPRLRLG